MFRTGALEKADIYVRHPTERTSYGYGPEVAGAGVIVEQLSRVVGQMLRDARANGLTRDDIGRRMAEAGVPVSKGSLDKWSSESESDRCIRLDVFIALVHATGAKDALGWLVSLFGLALVPADMAKLIQLLEIEQHEEVLKSRKRLILAHLRARR